MAKFKTGLIKGVRQELAEQNQQKELQEKYNMPDNVTIVEKNNFTKFFINILIRIIKTIAAICLCTLAVIGLISLFHPEMRMILLTLILETISYIL